MSNIQHNVPLPTTPWTLKLAHLPCQSTVYAHWSPCKQAKGHVHTVYQFAYPNYLVFSHLQVKCIYMQFTKPI